MIVNCIPEIRKERLLLIGTSFFGCQ